VTLAFNIFVFSWHRYNSQLPSATYNRGAFFKPGQSFVLLLIFSYFRVPHVGYYWVLFWGIIGSLVLLGLFIAFEITLILEEVLAV
jgi:hypothetical protein